MNDDEDDKALARAIMKRMNDPNNALKFGFALNETMKEFCGVVPIYTVVFGLPDGTLTRFTNVDADVSLAMLANVLRLGVTNREERTVFTSPTAHATKQ